MALVIKEHGKKKYEYTKVATFVYGPSEIAFHLDTFEKDEDNEGYSKLLSTTRVSVDTNNADFTIDEMSKNDNNPIKAAYKYMKKELKGFKQHVDA